MPQKLYILYLAHLLIPERVVEMTDRIDTAHRYIVFLVCPKMNISNTKYTTSQSFVIHGRILLSWRKFSNVSNKFRSSLFEKMDHMYHGELSQVHVSIEK